MKIQFVILSAIVLSCFVENGNCGVISDVYGNVRNKTVAVKDGVTSWLTYGKDWVLGNEKQKPEGRFVGEVVSDDGIFNRIYSTLLNGFQSARDNVYGFFVSDEKLKNNGFIRNMYEKVKNRITTITAFAIGKDDKEKPNTPDDLSEIRRALNTMINQHKNKQNQLLHEGVESLKDNVQKVDAKLHGGADKIKDSVNDMKKSAGDHISDSMITASETVNRGINDAKEVFSSTLNNWQESGVEISDKEREVLNAISHRIRNRITNLRSAMDNPHHLSYAEEEKKD